ncbi:MAG: hypothetical protein HY400_06230, partial [Elusimicrobia bacterium]|nr:hypothetical protein [Elusimicrobiota bacterium]
MKIYSILLFGGLFYLGSVPVLAEQANIMILLDSSGSMGWSLPFLPAYNSATTYSSTSTIPSCGYTSGAVYNQDSIGIYNFYSSNITSVSSAPAVAQLSTYGFWFGAINNVQLKLFVGNYLNYQACTARVSQTKISVAKRVITDMVNILGGRVRLGLMKFNATGTYTAPQIVVSTVGASPASIITALNAITAGGGTPLGEIVRDSGLYFKGQFGYPTPIQSACQPNSVIVISDGDAEPGPPTALDIRTQALNLFTQDSSATLAGLQNIVVHTVAFAYGGTGFAVLSTAAANGGGTFVRADDSAQ